MSQYVHLKNWYCPLCKNESLYEDEHDDGDYYLGSETYCISCNSAFHLRGGKKHEKEYDYNKFMEKLQKIRIDVENKED